jgi:hypothetical protein
MSAQERLESAVGDEAVGALDGKSVTDSRIPDDNNEGMIYLVGAPSEVDFDFDRVEYYGDSEVGVPFVAIIECTLNYAIFKSDFYCLDEDKAAKISTDERNDHYFDADEDYSIKVTGTLQIKLDANQLRNDEVTDEEILELIEDAEYNLEVDELAVA